MGAGDTPSLVSYPRVRLAPERSLFSSTIQRADFSVSASYHPLSFVLQKSYVDPSRCNPALLHRFISSRPLQGSAAPTGLQLTIYRADLATFSGQKNVPMVRKHEFMKAFSLPV